MFQARHGTDNGSYRLLPAPRRVHGKVLVFRQAQVLRPLGTALALHTSSWPTSPQNNADFFDAKNISIPFAMSVFPDELYQAPRSWAERAYPHNLIHYNKLDRGGHFVAWEQPQLFSEEVRAGFRSLR